jgi:hypothetical protein
MCVWEGRSIDTLILTSVREEGQSLASRTDRLTPEDKSQYLQVPLA